jgi:uncharacterized protein (TIGR00255 family)
VAIELRSVNGRGLSVKARLAPECQGLEAALEAYLRTRLTRGTVHVVLAVTEPASVAEASVDIEFAVRVAEQLEALAGRLGKSVTLADVLACPGVIPTQARQGPKLSRALPADLSGLLVEATDALLADRQREGAATADAILLEVAAVIDAVARIRARAPQVAADYRHKLLTRVNEFLAERANAMEDRDVIREVALFADRVDTSEELQRLDSHMAEVRAQLDAGGPSGRSLEFLVQEMLREANTLGSKSPDVEIAHLVVRIKSSIEKLKEQAANLL